MNILQRLSGITELPTLPEVVLKIRELILSDNGDAASLARIIEHDPSLSARVLKVANSSFYIGTAGPVISVERAVARIGFNEIGNLAMAASLVKLFSRKSPEINYHAFWRHSIGAAYLSSVLGKSPSATASTGCDADLFLAGLFHDIGILVYDQFFHEEFRSICSYAARNHLFYVKAEDETAPDASHSSIGASLLEIWKISPAVIEGVERHHRPPADASGESSIVQSVILSEILLRMVDPDAFEGPIDPAAGHLIRTNVLQTGDLPGLLIKANNAMELANAFYT